MLVLLAATFLLETATKGFFLITIINTLCFFPSLQFLFSNLKKNGSEKYKGIHSKQDFMEMVGKERDYSKNNRTSYCFYRSTFCHYNKILGGSYL